MSKVKVTADAAGNVIVPSKNNSEWGYIRVEQVRMVVDERGFARKRTVSAIIPGTIEDLKGFDWKAGQEVEGKIVIKERLEPFNEETPEKDYKIAGDTKVVCCLDGQPIYRKAFYSLNVNAHDETIEHNNGDAIKAAYAEMKEAAMATETPGNKL